MAIKRNQLNKMFKRLKKMNRVKIDAYYENDIGDANYFTFVGKLIDFIIDGDTEDLYDLHLDYVVDIAFLDDKNGSVRFDLLIPGDAWFDGYGKIKWINNGPTCYVYVYALK